MSPTTTDTSHTPPHNTTTDQLDTNPPWQGKLNLDFIHTNGKTTPTNIHSTAPLRIQRPFYPTAAPGNCQSVIVHTAGGMVGGDRLTMKITAADKTQALVTTAAAHKIYRSPGPWAEQTIHIQVAAGAYVEWLPQELILFNGGKFHQTLRVDLEPGSRWLGWDITRFGRSARGETLESGHWRSQTEIWQSDRPLWIDRQQLMGGSDVLTSDHGLAGYPVVGTFLLLGHQPDVNHLSQLREVLKTQGHNRDHGGMTQIEQGLVARYRGPSSQAARQYFTHIWQYLRTEALQQKAYVPRVWGV